MKSFVINNKKQFEEILDSVHNDRINYDSDLFRGFVSDLRDCTSIEEVNLRPLKFEILVKIANDSIDLIKKKNKRYNNAYQVGGIQGNLKRIIEKCHRYLKIEEENLSSLDENNEEMLCDIVCYAMLAKEIFDYEQEETKKKAIKS